MDIIETSVFTRKINELLADDDYAELQFALIQKPELGDINPRSGGYAKFAGQDQDEVNGVAYG